MSRRAPLVMMALAALAAAATEPVQTDVPYTAKVRRATKAEKKAAKRARHAN